MTKTCCLCKTYDPQVVSKLRKNRAISFHCFPRNDDVIRNKWIRIVKKVLPKFEVPKDPRICSLHFANSDYVTVKNRRGNNLVKGTVPSLFLSPNTTEVTPVEVNEPLKRNSTSRRRAVRRRQRDRHGKCCVCKIHDRAFIREVKTKAGLIRYHRFPRDSRGRLWIELAEKASSSKVSSYARICSLHFAKSDYKFVANRQTKYLKKNILPSLYMSPNSSGVNLTDDCASLNHDSESSLASPWSISEYFVTEESKSSSKSYDVRSNENSSLSEIAELSALSSNAIQNSSLGEVSEQPTSPKSRPSDEPTIRDSSHAISEPSTSSELNLHDKPAHENSSDVSGSKENANSSVEVDCNEERSDGDLVSMETSDVPNSTDNSNEIDETLNSASPPNTREPEDPGLDDDLKSATPLECSTRSPCPPDDNRLAGTILGDESVGESSTDINVPEISNDASHDVPPSSDENISEISSYFEPLITLNDFNLVTDPLLDDECVHEGPPGVETPAISNVVDPLLDEECVNESPTVVETPAISNVIDPDTGNLNDKLEPSTETTSAPRQIIPQNEEDAQDNSTPSSAEGNTPNDTHPNSGITDTHLEDLPSIDDSEKTPSINMDLDFTNDDQESGIDTNSPLAEESKSTRNQFDCDFCPKSFSNQGDLRAHKKWHASQKYYKCGWCEKVLATYQSWMYHINAHDFFKPFTCEYCEKSFATRQQLEGHTKCTRYTCRYCTKGFTTRERLKKHRNTHVEKKLHRCDVCDKHFFKESTMKIHKTKHEKKKIFTCEYCGNKYPTKEELLYHIKCTGENLIICAYCLDTFEDYLAFKLHIMKHKEEESFVCTICDKTFVSMDKLQEHIVTHSDQTVGF